MADELYSVGFPELYLPTSPPSVSRGGFLLLLFVASRSRRAELPPCLFVASLTVFDVSSELP